MMIANSIRPECKNWKVVMAINIVLILSIASIIYPCHVDCPDGFHIIDESLEVTDDGFTAMGCGNGTFVQYISCGNTVYALYTLRVILGICIALDFIALYVYVTSRPPTMSDEQTKLTIY